MSSLMDILRQKKNAMSRGGKTIKPNPGRNRYRILPGWRPADEKGNVDPTFYHDFGQHYIKDTAGEMKAVYMCVDKTYGRPCAICDHVSKAILSSPDDAVTKALEQAKSTQRILMNVLELDGEQPTTPQVLEIGPGIFGQIISLFDEWGEEMIDLASGQDIVISREGSGLSTKYTVQVASKSKPVDPSVMKKITNLDEFVAQESEEVARRALGAVSSVSGVLPVPTRSVAALGRPTDTPSTGGDWGSAISAGAGALSLDDQDDDLTTVATPTKASSTSADIDDLMAELEELPS